MYCTTQDLVVTRLNKRIREKIYARISMDLCCGKNMLKPKKEEIFYFCFETHKMMWIRVQLTTFCVQECVSLIFLCYFWFIFIFWFKQRNSDIIKKGRFLGMNISFSLDLKQNFSFRNILEWQNLINPIKLTFPCQRT